MFADLFHPSRQFQFHAHRPLTRISGSRISFNVLHFTTLIELSTKISSSNKNLMNPPLEIISPNGKVLTAIKISSGLFILFYFATG